MKKVRKINRDENAVSSGTIILIILIVGLLVWQIGGAYLGIPTITDLLTNDESAEFDMYFKNEITQQKTLMKTGFNTTYNIVDLKPIQPYQFQLETNLNSFGIYRLVILIYASPFLDSGMDNWEQSQYSVEGIGGLTSFIQSSYVYGFANDDDFSFWARIQLFSSDGIRIEQWDLRFDDVNNPSATYTPDTWGGATTIGGIWWNVWDE
jgi:hypothetical protein